VTIQENLVNEAANSGACDAREHIVSYALSRQAECVVGSEKEVGACETRETLCRTGTARLHTLGNVLGQVLQVSLRSTCI